MLLSTCGRKALSLLELVVVLGILAIIAGVTIQSLEPIADQARYDATVRSLEAIDKAIYDERQVSSDRVLIRGFIADIGRLPVTVGNELPLQAAELWDRNASDATANAHGTFTYSDTEIDQFSGLTVELNVTAGWNGPYIHPPRSQSTGLLDGWGRPFQFGPSGMSLADGMPMVTALSFGSDGLHDSQSGSGSSTYAEDLLVPSLQFNRHLFAGIDFQLMERSSGGLIEAGLATGERFYLLVFGPSDGQPARLFPPVDNFDQAEHSSENARISISIDTSPSAMSENITAGPRTLLALIAAGTWPNLTIRWQDIRVVNLFPLQNQIQWVK